MEQTKRIVEQLTKDELKQLKAKTAPYGKLNDVAIEAGLHVNTLRNILRNGGGLQDNIIKLRCSVFAANVQNSLENHNTAA